MDAKRYLDEIVIPTIDDFAANPTSKRHAFLACVATFHAVDYLAHRRSVKSLRQNFGKESSDFALIDRVAHAFKHVQSGHAASTIPLLEADSVIIRPPAFLDIMFYDISRFGDTTGGITISGEHQHDLLRALNGALKFLCEKCSSPSGC